MRLGLHFINAPHVPGKSAPASVVPPTAGSDSWPGRLGDISGRNGIILRIVISFPICGQITSLWQPLQLPMRKSNVQKVI